MLEQKIERLIEEVAPNYIDRLQKNKDFRELQYQNAKEHAKNADLSSRTFGGTFFGLTGATLPAYGLLATKQSNPEFGNSLDPDEKMAALAGFAGASALSAGGLGYLGQKWFSNPVKKPERKDFNL